MSATVASLTDPGLERTRNEDAVLVGELAPASWVLVVCDGMGGHDAGDLASQTASRRLYQEVNARQHDPDIAGCLVDALHAAHGEVRALAVERGGSDMGTTAVVARLIGPDLWFAWVGDSRLVVVRGAEVLVATVDHTVVQRLIDAGELDPAHAATHPDVHVLTQCVGGQVDEVVPAVTDAPVRLEAGDRVLLCSDGLHDLVRTDELPGLLTGRDPELAARALVELAKQRGGHDNITVVVVGWSAAEVPAVREPLPSRAPSAASSAPTEPRPPVRPVLDGPVAASGVPVPMVVLAVITAFAVGLALGLLVGRMLP